VLNAALGGGMSSRLFQEVREKRGLAYSVFSFTSQYADAGLVGVTAGCRPAKLAAVLDVCRAELATMVRHGITDGELDRGRAQLRGGLVLGMEDTGSRMTRLAKGEMFGDLPGINEVLRRIDSVTVAQVQQVADELLTGTPTLAVVGPFDDPSAFAGAVG
jgi:predicted Zn-dependent peptidase